MAEDFSDDDICKKLGVDKGRVYIARSRWRKKDPEYFNPKQVVEPVDIVEAVNDDGVKPVDPVVFGEENGKDLEHSDEERNA